MPEGFIYIEVEGDTVDRLTFRQTDAPNAVVEVTLNNQKIVVKPAALIAAINALNP